MTLPVWPAFQRLGFLRKRTTRRRRPSAWHPATACLVRVEALETRCLPATQLLLFVPGLAQTASPQDVTVEALTNGFFDPNYRGTVTFSSSDPRAVLPPRYTFTADDAGIHDFFLDGITFHTIGTQTVTAQDNQGHRDTESTIVYPAAVFFKFDTPASANAGVPFSVTVHALDIFGQADPDYTGTIQFSSSDSAAHLPANYTFTAADRGAHTFANAVSLQTPGAQNITAFDNANLISGFSAPINVVAAATHFVLQAPASVTAGAPFSITVTAADALNHADPNYRGIVHFSSTDASAALPSNYTFTAADRGVHTFTGVTLRTAGNQMVTTRDTANANLSGTTNITVSAPLARFDFSVPTSSTAGAPLSVTVTARDQNNNVITGYRGTVSFSSNDSQATVPGNYPFTAADNGVHTFTGVILRTAGSHTVTVRDTASSVSANGSIIVNPAATNHFDVGAPSGSTAGMAVSVTLTARDPYNNLTPGYRGMVSFSSNDSQATLPANYTFTAGDNGVHTFTGLILRTAGNQLVTARDTGAGFSSSATIAVSSAAASRLEAGLPAGSTAGAAFNGTVTARDPYGNVATGYRGTVSWASGDSRATLPGNYAFTAGDAGVHTFSGLILRTAGNQMVTVRDASAGFSASAGVLVSPAAASQVAITAPNGSTAGSALTITLTVRDPYNNLATGYRGTMTFSSDDTQATLPAGYAFTAADAGVHTFTNGVILRTAGSRSVTARDMASGFSGNAAILVNAASVSALAVMGFPSPTAAGMAGSFLVAARDAYGNLVAGYRGAIHVTSGDSQAVLPLDYTFTPSDNGVHTFSATLKTAGTQSLTATDKATASITGTQSGIVVNPAATSVLTVAGFPSSITAGATGNLTVTAKDAYGNLTPAYTGTVHLTSSDSRAQLPADYAFVDADQGVHLFPVTLITAGTQSLTAADTHSGSITGTQVGIQVIPADADHFQVTTSVATTVAGVLFDVTVTVRDVYNNTATGYTGTITFSSGDPYFATLPADYPFTAADRGVHTFRGGAILYTVGSWDVTAADTVSGIGGSATVAVTPAAADHFQLDAPSTTVAGHAVDLVVTALDAYGNIDIHYTGTITFSGSDPNSVLPANYTFAPADQGRVVFAGGATLFLAGSQSVAVNDLATGQIIGSATISVTPAAADHFQVDAPATVAPNMPFDVTVTALDPYGNVDMHYTGTVTFSTSDPDPNVVVPPDYPFVATDGGVHTFAGGFALVTPGMQTITATDTGSGINGSATVTVQDSGAPGAAAGRQGGKAPFSATAEKRTLPIVAAATRETAVAGKDLALALAENRRGRLQSTVVTVADAVDWLFGQNDGSLPDVLLRD